MLHSENLVPFTPEWEFFRKQEAVMASVGENPHIDDGNINPLPADLVDPVRRLIKTAGLTNLALYNPNYRVHNETRNRHEYLCKVRDKLQLDANALLNRVIPHFELPSSAKDALDYLRFNDYPQYCDFEYEIRKINESLANDYADELKSLHIRYSQCEQHLKYVNEVNAHLDITNSLSHIIETNDSEVVHTEWRKYLNENPCKHLDAVFDMPIKPNAGFDEVAKSMIKGQYARRRAEHIQRLNNETHIRSNDGWYMVFQTITFSDDGLRDYFKAENRSHLLNTYFKKIGRGVAKACGRDIQDSHSDIYKYYAVHEHGSQRGRFHYHVVHYCKELPFACKDPLYGRNLDNVQPEWNNIKEWPRFPFGMNLTLAVRYQGDAFTRRGWLAPRDKDGNIQENKPVDAVIRYIAKYVSKETQDRAATAIAKKEDVGKWQNWNKTLQELELETDWAQTEFRTRMSRGFGMELPQMENLSLEALEQLTRLHWSVTPLNALLKKSAKKQCALRAGILSMSDLQGNLPERMNLLKFLRLSIPEQELYKSQNSGTFETQKLMNQDISDEVKDYLALLAVKHKTKRSYVIGRSR